jgi:hypothetical protein
MDTIKLMRFILVITVMIISTTRCFCQIKLTGKIKSANTHQSIPYVMIKLLSNGDSLTTDDKGRFKIIVKELPCELNIIKDCFLMQKIIVSNEKKIIVYLAPKIDCDTTSVIIR